ncbi:MAG: tyrosine--tRNA ligase [Atopobiaceae bacterium]|jgi:tyrosyl-tRNA synthetase|uniref:Tyrosine--tRNA ligase n=1 Tax=Muricaecibacterium torontonense TaxID=3032871 RepID=A0A4S2F3M4_9ACTN|nr:tyrosine--tRNA ligase [Muricaecibacterium torontonense]MCI8676497.1 tyrosine--tRNA ligase [Atopobiaceae bacterium]TGY61814.1 tyrosine--tRNA ligase [Muricaecibacterium torontonense]
MLGVEEQMKVIESGAMQIVPQEELKKKLAKGTPLNIKLGVDPTSPDLHLGHAVPLRKMRQFQDLGHNVTLIIGNGTALIGDPSGRDSTRPPLTEEQVEANAKTYVEQAMKILDPEKTTIVHNGDWIKPLTLQDMLGLMSQFTVARILEREDFSNRYQNHLPIALHEFIYPVLQAYDSVMISADLEMGGNDQIFNLLAGRDLMEKRGMEPQVALTMPLLEGTDGHKKMSKSYGNYVGLTDEPADMYGKIMSIPDELLGRYYRLASTFPVEKVDAIDASLADGTADPYALKRQLAANIVELYHGAQAASDAAAAFDALFKEHQRPHAPEVACELIVNDEGKVYLPALLAQVGLAKSAGEGRRLIDGGGVRLNDEPLAPKTYNLDPSQVEGAFIQVGKRRAVQLV